MFDLAIVRDRHKVHPAHFVVKPEGERRPSLRKAQRRGMDILRPAESGLGTRLVVRFVNHENGTKTAYFINVQKPEFIFRERWINSKKAIDG